MSETESVVIFLGVEKLHQLVESCGGLRTEERGRKLEGNIEVWE